MKDYLVGEHPIAFAHRGGAALWPENTLEAFGGALDLGYRYIETDIHMTRDGEIVVLHDPIVDRTTDGHGDVRDMTLAEVKRLDAGYRFNRDGDHPFRGRGIDVPTLDEALDLHPELRFNLEIKQRSPDLARPLWDFIERRGVHDRVLVASAKDDVGDAFRRLAGRRVRTSPGVRGGLRFWLGVRSGLWRADSYPYDALQAPRTRGRLTVVDRRFVRAAHAHGIQVHVWTIDDPTEMRELLALGVDGIMTDRPDVLKEVLGTRGRFGPQPG